MVFPDFQYGQRSFAFIHNLSVKGSCMYATTIHKRAGDVAGESLCDFLQRIGESFALMLSQARGIKIRKGGAAGSAAGI
eukprot:5365021-Amphidinium_carterae.1